MTNKKVFVVVIVANQVDGNGTLVKIDKVFSSAKDAETYFSREKRSWKETITVNNSTIECVCERGIQEADFEEKGNLNEPS